MQIHSFLWPSHVYCMLLLLSCPTLGNSMNGSTPGFPVHHHFPELAQTLLHELVTPSNHLILYCLLLLLPSVFPSIRVFSNASGDQSIGASVSAPVLPMNIQHWFPLGLTSLAPCSPRDSQESSSAPQFQRINSLELSLLYGPALITIHDYWINRSFDYSDLCWQSHVFAF